MTLEFTADELIAACISRRIQDGDMVVQGLATPLTLAGYILAKLTHAPNIVMASAIGNVATLGWHPLSLSRVEAMWLDKPLRYLDFSEIGCELLPTMQPKEFLRPAQVDRHGHFNNVVIGDWNAPTLRLPGCGGIADITPIYHRVFLYVPRHSAKVFVEKADFRSGVGAKPGEERDWVLVSNLGTFDLHQGQVRLKTLHPGVSLEQVQECTGFSLQVAAPLEETAPPTAGELRLLREVIDPLGLRKTEMLSGDERKSLLQDIVHRESALQ